MELAASGIQGPGPDQMPPDYIIPDRGPNSGERLMDTLNSLDAGNGNGNIISQNNKDILIALMLMVNKADPTYSFDFIKCEEFLTTTIRDILADPQLDDEAKNREIYNHMITMAIVSQAPIGSPTILKVQSARRVFLYLLAIGASYGLLRTVVPDTTVAICLEYANRLFELIITGGMGRITNADIAAGAASNPPFSAEVFAGNMVRTAASAASYVAAGAADLTTASFMALARGVGSCLRFAVGSANYALCRASELLTFNLLTSGVIAGAEAAAAVSATAAAVSATNTAQAAVGAAAEGAYAIAMKTSDEALANLIDENAAKIRGAATRDNFIALANAAVTGAVEIYETTLTSLEEAKRIIQSQVDESITDMTEINREFNEAGPDWVPNRFVGITINEIIRNAFGEAVLLDSELFRTHLGDLIGLLSSIRIGTPYEETDINRVAEELNIPDDPHPLRNKFRALIALWKLSVERAKIRRSISVPLPGMSYAAARMGDIRSLKPEKRKVRNEGESDSFPEEYNAAPDSNDPFATRGATKNPKQLGPQQLISANPLVVNSEVNPIKKLEQYFNNDENLRNANTELGIYSLIASQSEEKQLEIIEALKKTASKSLLGVSDKQRIDNMHFNTQKIKETVDRLLGRVMLDSIDIDDDGHPQSAASAASAASAPNNYYNLGGRKRKSMRHRKRRSTIRRKKGRRVGRKTRKGKKKRYTKKRR